MTAFEGGCDLAAQGVPVFPCNADKRPICARGFHDATTQPQAADFARAALVGMPTGAPSGFAVLDIDPRHGGDAWLAEHAAKLPVTRTGHTRSGGRHLYFKAPPGLRCSAGKIARGVDMRADLGYVIRWDVAGLPVEHAATVADMPEWLLAAASGTRTQHSPAALNSRDVSAPDPAAVVSLLDAMPNNATVDRDTWLQVMLAARGCCGEHDDPDIAEAAIGWASRWPFSPGADAERTKWEDDFATRDAPLAGWESLIAAAGKLGVDTLSWRVDAAAAAFAASPLPAEPPNKRRRMRDRLVRPVDCATGARRGYLIKHLLAPGDVAAIIGAPSTGKSTLAPYLAYGLAQGRKMFGLRVKAGRVLYVAAEDFSGMRQRIDALRLEHGDAPAFAVVDTESLLEPIAQADLLDAVGFERPALVVIDTVGAAWAGLDENDAAGMGEVVALARRVASGGAAVLLIHHTAKNGDGTPRGHSVLNGTLDMCLSLAAMGDDRIVRGKLTKNRNGACEIDLAFRLDASVLGLDEDGDEITAPIAVELKGGTPAAVKLSPRESRAMEILRDIGGAAGVSEQAWREACDDQRLCASDNPKSRAKVTGTALRSLLEKRLVLACSGTLRIAPAMPAID